MYVTQHASDRLFSRLSGLRSAQAADIRDLLELIPGEPGHVAYLVAGGVNVITDDGSNGDTVVAVAVDGSVETVFFRRSWNQSLGPDAFGCRKVVALVPVPAELRPEA